MRIEKVSYQKVFPLGMYINEKIGVELVLNEGDDAMEALSEARKVTHEFFDKNNPEPFISGVKIIEEAPQQNIGIKLDKKTQKEQQEDNFIKLINECTEIEKPLGVKAYELISNNNPKLKTAYDNKLKKLNEQQGSNN